MLKKVVVGTVVVNDARTLGRLFEVLSQCEGWDESLALTASDVDDKAWGWARLDYRAKREYENEEDFRLGVKKHPALKAWDRLDWQAQHTYVPKTDNPSAPRGPDGKMLGPDDDEQRRAAFVVDYIREQIGRGKAACEKMLAEWDGQKWTHGVPPEVQIEVDTVLST